MELNNLIAKLLQYPIINDDIDITNLIKKLNIAPTYPIILVGGTNGKGSVCAYLTTILTIAGFNVGTFTSPHVFNYNERICINNKPIDDETLGSTISEIISHTDSIGLFKTFTLAAHKIFIKHNIDIAIIEVGIGGLNDITNLFEPTISAVTNVDFDHMDILGDTIDAIGYQKSGIYRHNKSAFFGSDNPPSSLINNAKAIGANLQIFGTNFGVNRHELSFDVWCKDKTFYSLPYPSLRGDTQANNVALSLSILHELKNSFPISSGMIKTGLLKTTLIGRFQVLPGSPQIILDVAHNPHSVTTMLSNMLKLPFAPQNVAVFGIAKDKDAVEVIKLCADKFDKWFIAKTNTARAMDTNSIAKILIDQGINSQKIIECDSIAIAYQNASQIENARIICFGSFLVVEEAYKMIEQLRQ
jgi:dihydrofolate synthase/folylpolyglutamate synthase